MDKLSVNTHILGHILEDSTLVPKTYDLMSSGRATSWKFLSRIHYDMRRTN
jgi:hypothetical protein